MYRYSPSIPHPIHFLAVKSPLPLFAVSPCMGEGDLYKPLTGLEVQYEQTKDFSESTKNPFCLSYSAIFCMSFALSVQEHSVRKNQVRTSAVVNVP